LYTKLDFDVTAASNGGTADFTLTVDIFDELESKLGMSINGTDNELWSVVPVGKNFRLEARRFGHGVGMSQRGAMQMGSMGYGYDQILGFYYENSKRVQYTFTHTVLSHIENGGKDTITSTENPAELTQGAENQATVKLVGVQDSLGVRAAADGNAPVLTSVVNGGMVTVLARRDNWTLVRLGKIVGYVPTSALVFTSTPPETSTESPTNITQWATVNCSGKLNLRASASTSAGILTSMPEGAVLCVFETNNGWAHVQYGAMAGWASMDFLQMNDSYPGRVTDDLTTTARVELSSGSGTVNLRESASTTARVLTTIPHGNEVNLVTDDGSWCFVQYNGQEGYVMSRYLAVGSGSAAPPPQGETPDASAPSLGTGEMEAIVKTASTSLNMREEASTSSRVLMSLPRGESIVVTGRGDEWSAVRVGNLHGYVKTMYLSFPADENAGTVSGYAIVNTQSGPLNMRTQPQLGSSIVQRIPKGAQVGLIHQADKWYRVSYNGQTGYVMTSYLRMQGAAEQPEGSTGAYATVNTPSGGLNLRETASDQARVLLAIPQGTALAILSHENGWCRVTYAGKTGYVMDKYLRFTNERPDDAQQETADGSVQVATGGGGLNLRETASDQAKVLLSIPNGAQVTMLQKGSDWCRVRYNGAEGYVMTRYLSLDEAGESIGGAWAWVKTQGGGLNLRAEASEQALILQSVPNHAKVGLTNYGSPWSQITYAGQTGYVMSQYLTLVEPEEAPVSKVQVRYVCTAYDALNIRSEGSGQAQVLGAVPRGSAVTLLESGSVWSRIQYNDLIGWAKSAYLGQEPPAVQQQEQDVVWQAVISPGEGNVNLRSAPSTDALVLLAIPKGETARLLTWGESWCKIRYKELDGYCMTQYLTLQRLN